MKDDEKYPRNDRAAYGEILRAAAAAVEKDKDARWEAARRHVRAGSVPPDFPFQDGDPTAYDPERKAYRSPANQFYTEPGTEHASAAYELGAGNPQQAQHMLHEQFHRDHRMHRIAGPVIPPQRSKSERVVDAVLVFLIVALVTAAALQAAGVLTQ
jgi:hypothetical protein